nr:urokinase plasminogen activator surface receptor isoform X2 [Pelodiscus sinensis]|eukprot:XP_025046205.1 urokinase plasminogen activator surface receptor isoform X2 [Pelodiscus sinensis]
MGTRISKNDSYCSKLAPVVAAESGDPWPAGAPALAFPLAMQGSLALGLLAVFLAAVKGQVPQRSAQNSRQCPACVGETAEQCRSDARVSCSGPEDRCFDFAGTLVNSTTTQVWRGCATESICQLQINETFFYSNQTYTLTSTRCTNRAPPTVTQALASSPLLAGLLLLRQLL